jgi:hypothetical protein
MKYLWITCIAFCSCARIPIEAVQLSDALKEEAERMHLLNLTLVDKMFNEKVHMVNEFITNEYTPAIVDTFKARLPRDTDFEADFTEMMQALYPRINKRKDSLIGVLSEQKIAIVNKLNQDYKVFNSAFTEMQLLLRSANKVNQQRVDVFAQVKALSGNRFDLENIDKALNKFITDGAGITDKSLLLTNTIQTLLK